jgi:hypothetical protein
MDVRRSWKFLVAGFLFSCLILGGGFFYFRSPVVLVSDAAFDALYGIRRTWEKRILLSLRFFRQVKIVLAAENTGADMLVFAIEEAHGAPYCVLFPYRYFEAAGRYAAQFSRIPVALFGGRAQEAPEEGNFLFIPTDIQQDFYLAGRCAAVFAESGGKILFFQENSMPAAIREAFMKGLREQGFEGEPLFLSAGAAYSGSEQPACVVMLGSAVPFLEQHPDLPVILFSWINPNLTARGVKIIFDDSPWAMAARTVSMIARGAEARPLRSDILFFQRRMPERGFLQKITDAIGTNMQ